MKSKANQRLPKDTSDEPTRKDTSVDKATIQDRIKTLETERTSMLARYDGAILDCQHWLQTIEEAEKSKE